MEWNAFDPAVRRRVEEASHAEASAAARERETAAQLLLERKRAQAQFEAAQERVRVSEAAGAEAEESLRIVKNRYEAGLARVDEVLRAETALLEARMRRLAAVYEQRMGAVAVELAAGALREDSDVLN
jgi:outer membrane protein TolC